MTKGEKIVKFNEKTEGLINFCELKKVRFKLLYWLMFAILIFISLVCIVPIIWVVVSAVKPTEEMYRVPPTIFPESFDLGVLKNAWQKVQFGKYFLNSAIIIVGAWVCDVFFNGICGYVLSRLKPKGTKLVTNLMFWTLLMANVSMVPLYETFVSLGGIGHFWPLWLQSGCIAFNVLLFRNFFNSIPMSYIEAARIDGLSELKIFFKIIIPLSVPIIMVVTIFSVSHQWSNFMWPYLILSGDRVPVSVKLFMLDSNDNIMENEKMAIMLFSIIPPAIMYCLFSKHIMGGVSMTGIKG